jgi:hypothetical protein
MKIWKKLLGRKARPVNKEEADEAFLSFLRDAVVHYSRYLNEQKAQEQFNQWPAGEPIEKQQSIH